MSTMYHITGINGIVNISHTQDNGRIVFIASHPDPMKYYVGTENSVILYEIVNACPVVISTTIMQFRVECFNTRHEIVFGRNVAYFMRTNKIIYVYVNKSKINSIITGSCDEYVWTNTGLYTITKIDTRINLKLIKYVKSRVYCVFGDNVSCHNGMLYDTTTRKLVLKLSDTIKPLNPQYNISSVYCFAGKHDSTYISTRGTIHRDSKCRDLHRKDNGSLIVGVGYLTNTEIDKDYTIQTHKDSSLYVSYTKINNISCYVIESVV